MGAIGAYEAGRDRNRQVMQQDKHSMQMDHLMKNFSPMPALIQQCLTAQMAKVF